MWNTPRKCNPAMMMTTPAILLRISRFFGDQLTGECRRGAEDDKDRGEAEHEGEGGHDHRRVDMRRRLVLAGELVERRAAEEAEIRRHERQHARREEAQQPRDQRSEIGDVHVRALVVLTWAERSDAPS